MFHRLIVPLDGSPLAEKAIPVAARIARSVHGSIVLTNVVLPGHVVANYGSEAAIATAPTTFEKALSAATSYLARVKQTYKDELQDVAVELDTETGETVANIVSTAAVEQADLIVMCSHKETVLTHWFLKHITQRTIRHSSVPVLCLNEDGVPLQANGASVSFHVLIPLDGSPLAETALEAAAQLLEAVTTPTQNIVVHLLRVINTSDVNGYMWSDTSVGQETARQLLNEAKAYLKTIARQLQKEWLPSRHVQVKTKVSINTNTAETILQHARRIQETYAFKECDLIVMATQDHSGLQRFLPGSVTEHIVGHTSYPLLVVHPQEKHAYSLQR